MDLSSMFDGFGSSVFAAIAGAVVTPCLVFQSVIRLDRGLSNSLRRPVKAQSRFRLVS